MAELAPSAGKHVRIERIGQRHLVPVLARSGYARLIVFATDRYRSCHGSEHLTVDELELIGEQRLETAEDVSSPVR